MAGLIASTSGTSPSTRFRPRSAVIRSLAAAITFSCGRSTEQRPLERAQIYRSVHRRRALNARTERRPEESAAAYRSAHLCSCCGAQIAGYGAAPWIESAGVMCALGLVDPRGHATGWRCIDRWFLLVVVRRP